MLRLSPLMVLLALTAATAARPYEGQVRREEVDGGVHVPVLTRPPELVMFVEARYPEEARQEGRVGSVKLQVTIAEDGSVADAQVVEPAGHGFDEAALEAVKQFKFTPAEVDHAPAAVAVEYVYHFTLDAPDAGAGVPPAPPPVAAEAVLRGELVARGSRYKVGAATVRCGDGEGAPEALSGEQGRFELKVPSGECAVRVTANGYEPFTTTETLEPGELREVVYHLMPHAIGYQTVVRAAREKKEVVRRTLQRAELQRIPGTFGDPVRVIQNMPGVARPPAISGALIVRGASPDQTLTLMDGVEIPLLYHLGGGPSVINAEFLDRVDFYPGGFGARFGRAVGGMVDVATRKGATDTWHGSAKVDLLDSGFFVEAPVVPGVSVAAAARRSYIDVLLPLVQPSNSVFAIPRYWDYQVRVDWGSKRALQPGEPQSTFYLMAFGSDDVLKVIATGGFVSRDIDLNVRTTFHRLKGDWTYRDGSFTSVFSPFAGYDLGEFSLGVAQLQADQYNLGFREDLTWEALPWLTLRGGADVIFEHLVGRAELPVISGAQYPGFPGAEPKREVQTISRTPNTFDGALYAEADFKAGPFTVTPGVRASYARVYGHDLYAADARLWLRWQPWEALAVKGSVGLYTQPPEATDMDPPPFGTPTLVHEKAFQSALGFEQRLLDHLTVDITGYFNRRFDLVVSPGEVVINEDGSVTQDRFANKGLGRAYGMEVLLRHEVTREFFGWLAYTWNRSEVRRVGQRDYRLANFDQTHIVTAVGSYRLPAGWELGARFRYVTGRPTAPVAHLYDIYAVDGNGYSCEREPPGSSRLPDFHQLDVRLDKNFVFRDWTLGVYIDVQNVYYAQNIETYITDYRCRAEIGVPGIPVLPVLGVKGSF